MEPGRRTCREDLFAIPVPGQKPARTLLIGASQWYAQDRSDCSDEIAKTYRPARPGAGRDCPVTQLLRRGSRR